MGSAEWPASKRVECRPAPWRLRIHRRPRGFLPDALQAQLKFLTLRGHISRATHQAFLRETHADPDAVFTQEFHSAPFESNL